VRPAGLRQAAAVLLAVLVLSGCGGGGGSGGTAPSSSPSSSSSATLGPANLAVLIAEGDATSEAIGLAYQRARSIPDANLIRLPVPRGSDSLSVAEFASLKAALDARLGDTIQATLVTWAQPSRVQGTLATPCAMGLTSALAFGYDTRYCGGCVATAASGYYNADTRQPWTDLKLRPSMMLGAATLAEAQVLISRGVAADGSWANGRNPGGTGYLLRTSDSARSVRHPDFQALASSGAGRVSLRYIDNASGAASDVVSNQSGVMFYFTGLASVPQIRTNSYLPGAVADHLTSLGAASAGATGQMPATDWLRAGATASYGTVTEPCNYPEKFPRASVMVRQYQRGQTLIEAYWKSVQWPGEGLFVGEPLAKPWAP